MIQPRQDPALLPEAAEHVRRFPSRLTVSMATRFRKRSSSRMLRQTVPCRLRRSRGSGVRARPAAASDGPSSGEARKSDAPAARCRHPGAARRGGSRPRSAVHDPLHTSHPDSRLGPPDPARSPRRTGLPPGPPRTGHRPGDPRERGGAPLSDAIELSGAARPAPGSSRASPSPGRCRAQPLSRRCRGHRRTGVPRPAPCR